jgi:hypothetical protein
METAPAKMEAPATAAPAPKMAKKSKKRKHHAKKKAA